MTKQTGNPPSTLTPRETEVLGYLMNGYTVKGITDAMNIAVQTASTLKRSAMRKLGANTDVILTKTCIRLGFTDL